MLFDHFLQKKKQHEGQENALASVPQQWFQKLLGIQKVWLQAEDFEPKLSAFSKNYFSLPQSTYFETALSLLELGCGTWKFTTAL